MLDALQPLFEGFQSDGLSFALKEARPDGLTLIISRDDTAYDECVLPAESIEELFSAFLREAGYSRALVRVVEAAF